MTLKLGDLAPDFTLLSQDEKKISLKNYRGSYVILYFYPKDLTPGCTLEASDFEHLAGEFKKQGVQLLGISKDPVRQHQKFAEKCGLSFPLLADDAGEVCKSYHVLAQKSMFGKKYLGIERTTLLIDPEGKIAHIWPTVEVIGHAKDVLNKLIEIKKQKEN